MSEPLKSLLDTIYAQILALNGYLKADQDILPQRKIEAIEKADIEKLEIRNTIDALVQEMHAHPVWPEFQAALKTPEDFPPYRDEVQLWEKIQQALDVTQYFININQKVVEESLAYYARIFHNIVHNLSEEDAAFVYEKDRTL